MGLVEGDDRVMGDFLTALLLVADGVARSVTMACFPVPASQLGHLAAIARGCDVDLLPTVRAGGKGIDLVLTSHCRQR